MEVIPLQSRPASELQPLISPLLEPSEHLIANGSNLIVKARPARIKEIKKLISKLDTRLHNLIITVMQSRTQTAQSLNSGGDIRISYGVNNRYSRPSAEIRGRFAQTEGLNNTDSTQVIKTLEGTPAYIKTGTDHPVHDVTIYDTAYGSPAVSTNTRYIETSTGFIINPRLTGQRVTMEISPWSDNMDNRRNINTQSASSTISVNLGVWVELGGITEQQESSSSGNISHSYTTKNKRTRILIKVDKSP